MNWFSLLTESCLALVICPFAVSIPQSLTEGEVRPPYSAYHVFIGRLKGLDPDMKPSIQIGPCSFHHTKTL